MKGLIQERSLLFVNIVAGAFMIHQLEKDMNEHTRERSLINASCVVHVSSRREICNSTKELTQGSSLSNVPSATKDSAG